MKNCKCCGKEFEDPHPQHVCCYECRADKRQRYYQHKKQEYIRNGANAYSQIRQRCNNPCSKDYRFYGAKGIKLLMDKKSFCIFYSSNNTCEKCGCTLNTDKTSSSGKCVDRIDSSKHYEEGNLRIRCRSCNTVESANKQFGKRPPKEDLVKLYIDEKYSISDVSKKYSVCTAAVIRWLQKYSIERRSRSQANYLRWEKIKNGK